MKRYIPFDQLKSLLQEEKKLGVSEPECAVLSTVTAQGNPHSRVVAIREIETESLLFFTQKLSRKVAELQQNPNATLNFWLGLQQRQVILEGVVTPLSQEDNQRFWDNLPRERQLRFSSYAPTSGQVISDSSMLEKRKEKLLIECADQIIPMSEHYCGFRFIPHTMFFYTIGVTTFSEVIRYSKIEGHWKRELLSP